MRAVERSHGQRKHAPGWVKRIADYLQDNYAKKMPLAELARIADVHPAYMARHFHKTYACTIGDYVRAVRVDRASPTCCTATVRSPTSPRRTVSPTRVTSRAWCDPTPARRRASGASSACVSQGGVTWGRSWRSEAVI